tara:strand:- start:10792 stop:11889 length:1098 start_codon:yes stop_codon:yes gene_type:complete
LAFYFFSFIFLLIPAIHEIEHYPKIKSNKIFYLTPLLLFFIGFRDQIGCDWASNLRNFNYYSDLNFLDYLYQNTNFEKFLYEQEIGYAFINIFIGLFTKSFYIFNFFLSCIFTIPLIYFCSKLKRPFLTLLISFPYYITIIGMGPLKQSLAISFLLLAFHELQSNNIFKYFLLNSISILFHRSSIIFILLPLLVKDKLRNSKIISNKFFYLSLFVFLLISIFIQKESFSRLIIGYFVIRPQDHFLNTIYLWTLVSYPSIIYLFFKNKFKSLNLKNNMWEILSISSIFIILGTFINSTITLRLILYFYPLKLFLISNIPDLKILNIGKKNMSYLLIFFSIFQLTTWLAFANHAYCWVPYKNIIFSS